MADSSISVTEGAGKDIDTRTESTNSEHRYVFVLGDPSDNDGVAPVDGTTGLTVLRSEKQVSVASSDGTPITTATTTTVIAAPGASTHLRIYKIYAQNAGSTDCEVSFQENGGNPFREETLTQYQPVSLAAPDGSYIKLTSNTALEMVTGAAGSVTYTVLYTSNAD